MESALKLLGILGSPSEIEVVDLLEKGLTKQNYQKAKEFTGFSHQDMAMMLGSSTTTLSL